MALTNTLPLTLTGALLDVPDAATGLVHLGGGRWYDPALGRPLQPNPAGGPPTMPQAMNRYAATPLGQPGVYKAIIAAPLYGALSQTNPTSIALRDTVAQSALGYVASKAIETTATGSLTIITSKSSWYRTIGQADLGLRSLFRQPSVAQPQYGKTFRAYTTLGNVREIGNGQYLAETGEIIDTVELPGSAKVNFAPRSSPLLRNLAGAGFAFGISGAFQWVEDISDPYLTSGQRPWRIAVSGVGGVGAWGIGLGAAEIAAGAGAGSWAGPIGVVVGGAATFVWIKWVQPIGDRLSRFRNSQVHLLNQR